MEILVIRPDDIGKGKVNFFSDQIINKMAKVDELDVIGISNGISLACSATRMSSEFARVHIKEAFLNYLDIPILGKIGGVFFTLTGEQTVDWDSEKASLEKGMKLSFAADGQLVVISQNLPVEQMIPLCLKKLWKNDTIKIQACGASINRAVNLALEITRGKISREAVGIVLMTLSTIRGTFEGKETAMTGLEIFLRKGNETKYSKHHEAVLERLRKANS